MEQAKAQIEQLKQQVEDAKNALPEMNEKVKEAEQEKMELNARLNVAKDKQKMAQETLDQLRIFLKRRKKIIVEFFFFLIPSFQVQEEACGIGAQVANCGDGYCKVSESIGNDDSGKRAFAERAQGKFVGGGCCRLI